MRLKKMFDRLLVFGIALTGWIATATGAELAVKVENLSKPVLCAEEDNVTLTFTSPRVRRFRIEALHPAYLAGLDKDNWKADWRACSFGPKAAKQDAGKGAGTAKPTPPAAAKLPQRETLFEAPDRWLVGLRFPDFWRKAATTVRVGDKVTKGLHLLQLWRVRPNGGEEVLVLYPQDGYWRARPKAPKGRDLTAFGSSFLIGPVEHDERPLVRLKEIAYDPALEGFELSFVKGGTARVRLAEASATRLALDVTLTGGIEGGAFAALRSMYVTRRNNDVADVAGRDAGAGGWNEAAIMAFKGGSAAELWAGRHQISRHNTSSPDMVFKWFRE